MLAVLADNSSALARLWDFLRAPIVATPWADWRGFWLGQILADRFVVCYCLPLALSLLLLSRRHLRGAVPAKPLSAGRPWGRCTPSERIT